MCGLPIVNDEVGYSLQHDIPDNDPDIWLKEYKRIKKINPTIAKWLKQWTKKCKPDRMGVLMCGIMVYKLLESQSEADDLRDIIG